MTEYNRPTSEFERDQEFWLSPPMPGWSERLAIPPTDYQTFLETFIKAAKQTGHRYTGLVELDNKGSVTSYTGTTYPRKKYPTPSIRERHAALMYLGEQFDATPKPDAQQQGTIRAVIGLYAGQQDTYNTPPDFNPAEIEQALSSDSRVTPAQVLTVRFGKGNTTSTYTEPVAIVTAPLDLAKDICDLGVALQQERFTLETFDAGSHTVTMVETIHCQEPEYHTS